MTVVYTDTRTISLLLLRLESRNNILQLLSSVHFREWFNGPCTIDVLCPITREKFLLIHTTIIQHIPFVREFIDSLEVTSTGFGLILDIIFFVFSLITEYLDYPYRSRTASLFQKSRTTETEIKNRPRRTRG